MSKKHECSFQYNQDSDKGNTKQKIIVLIISKPYYVYNKYCKYVKEDIKTTQNHIQHRDIFFYFQENCLEISK